MIDVFLQKGRLCVSLDPEHEYFDRAYVIVNSLLTSRKAGKKNVWYISYDDLGFLKNKLDLYGLVNDRTIEEKALDWINNTHSRHLRNDDIKKGINNEHVRSLLEGKLKTTPYEDQITAISYLINNRRAGLFDTMGFGKSVELLAAIVALGHQIKRGLIICPLSVMFGFAREVQKHTYLKSISVPQGREEAFQFIKNNVDGDWDLMFVHPENLISNKKGQANIYGDITKLLKSMIWDIIAIDEFHRYKNWDAKRTKCVIRITNESKDKLGDEPRVIPMTGTPISESPSNAYSILRIVDRSFNTHLTTFENHFQIKKKVRYGKNGPVHKKLTGYKNLDELKVMIERVSIRRTKDDVEGFPDQIPVVRDVLLHGKQLALYNAICGEIIRGLPKESQINLSQFVSNNTKVLRLRQIINHPGILDESGDSAKYEEIDSILEELLADEEQKVVIWTEFRAAVDLLYERYNGQYGAAKVYGGVSQKKLDEIGIKFENEQKPKIIIGIPAKAGEGTDWLARARTVIYVDRPYSFILYNQSLDRTCRRIPPVKNLSKLDRIRAQPSTVIYLDVLNSVDWLIRDQAWEKQKLVDALTTGNERLVELGREDLLQYLR